MDFHFVLLDWLNSLEGLDPENIKHFTLVQCVEQKCVNFDEPFEKKLTAGDLLLKAKRAENFITWCTPRRYIPAAFTEY